jgi:hypothetical protein
MKLTICLGIGLICTSLLAADEPSASEILQRYLKLPPPTGRFQVGAERDARFKVLDELRSTSEGTVPEIMRILPEVNSIQRSELASVLYNFPTKESAAALCALLDDPDEHVRNSAISYLRMFARRVDRAGGQRTQRGGVFAPKVDGLVPFLIKAANDKVEQNRLSALYALADSLDAQAIAELRNRLKDESPKVRFYAACFLTEFNDISGVEELKQGLARLRSTDKPQMEVDSMYFDTEILLASFARITGTNFGEIPRNPSIMSDTRAAQDSERRYKKLLDAWANYWLRKMVF